MKKLTAIAWAIPFVITGWIWFGWLMPELMSSNENLSWWAMTVGGIIFTFSGWSVIFSSKSAGRIPGALPIVTTTEYDVDYLNAEIEMEVDFNVADDMFKRYSS